MRRSHCRVVALTIASLHVFSLHLGAQSRTETNVVYGVYSGTALLLDVIHPDRPNGLGVVLIPGSGWMAPPGPSGAPLTQSPQNRAIGRALATAGYTVFDVNYRGTPTFRYPTPVEDIQRAVRFIRSNAARFGIDSVRLGGYGGSSGGHLVGLLATMDGDGDASDPDPVSHRSAKLQCVVTVAAPVDLTRPFPSTGPWGAEAVRAIQALALFVGGIVWEPMPKNYSVYKTAWAASPLRYVSTDDASFLLIHGDADQTVPIAQSVMMEQALLNAGVPVRLVRIEGGDHSVTVSGAPGHRDYLADAVEWYDACFHADRRGQS